MADRLDPCEWVHHLPSIPVGGRRRYPHECGEGRPLVVFKGDPESSAYCHRCGKLGRHERVMSNAERLAYEQKRREADRSARSKVELPPASSHDPGDWPPKLRNWFYRMGLGPAHLAALGCYYSDELDRVVVPLKEDGRPVYWIARSQMRSPKWLTPDVPKGSLIVKFGEGRGDRIVVLEDPLSAYKVGLECEAWCLFGTKLKDGVLAALLADPRPVVTWLDDDHSHYSGKNPGQEAALLMRKRLRALGKQVTNMTSDRDPKYMSRDFIREVLQ
ncbi:DNA primase [Stenotrophomonas phage BUCT603]|nr:DNA primase [Stenotrophomonas phage BUCT603]